MNSNLQLITTIQSLLEEGSLDYYNSFMDNLEQVDFSSAERRRLLYIATDYQAKDKQASLRLALLALEGARIDLIEDVTMSFAYWNSEMRTLGLAYFAKLNTALTITRFTELIELYYDQMQNIPFDAVALDQLADVVEHTQKCFSVEVLKIDYYKAALKVVDRLSVDYLAVLRNNLIADLIVLSGNINNYRSFVGVSWIWEQPGYLALREFAAVLLDLAGAIGDESFVRSMRAFMRIRDMKIRYHSAIAVLHFGGRIRKTDYIALAGNSEMRIAFYRTLVELGLVHDYPMQFKSNRYFAEGLLVNHLQNLQPNGQVPNEVIFVQEHQVLGDHGKETWILFKYEQEKLSRYYPAVVGPFTESDDFIGSAQCYTTDLPWDQSDSLTHLGHLIPRDY